MTSKSNKKKIQTKDEIMSEIAKLSEQSSANTKPSEDLFLGSDMGDEIEDYGFDLGDVLNSTADPQKSYRLFYTIHKTLMMNLPKDKKIRSYVLEQKAIFLTGGYKKDKKGVRGADSRMSFIPHFLQLAAHIVTQWVIDGADPVDIFNKFYDLNVERGYIKPNEENEDDSDEKKNDTQFLKTLKAVASVPPPQKNKKPKS